MDRRFIILLVFASVTQNCIVLSSKISDKYSIELLQRLDEFVSIYLDELSLIVDGTNSFFRTLGNLKALRSNSSTENVEKTDAAITRAFADVRSAISDTYNSIKIIGNGTCVADGTGILGSLDKAIFAIIDTLDFARAGNYSENKAKVEENRYTTKTGFAQVVGKMFDLISSCANSSRDNDQVLIQNVRSIVAGHLVKAANSIHSAIEIYAIEGTGENGDENVSKASISIDSLRVVAEDQVISGVQQLYALCEAIHVNNYLNKTKLLREFLIIQLAQKITTRKFTNVVRGIYISIIKNYSEVYEIIGNDDIGTSNSTVDKSLEELLGAGDTYVNAVRLTLPSSINLRIYNLVLPNTLRNALLDYYYGISLIRNGTDFVCPENLLAMKSLRVIHDETLDFLIGTSFFVLRGYATTATEIEPVISNLQRSSIRSAQNTSGYIYTSIERGGEIYCSKSNATREDLLAWVKYWKLANAESHNEFKYLFYALLIKVIDGAGYSVGIESKSTHC